jgi:ketosteroid isomerase-like protein
MKMLCVLALAGAMAAPLAAQEKDNGSAESKVIAMEKAWNQAYKSRDGKALGTILHDSVVLVNDDGTLASKSGFLSEINKAKASENQQADPESITVRVFDNVAIATGVFRQKGVENGKSLCDEIASSTPGFAVVTRGSAYRPRRPRFCTSCPVG